MSVMTDYADRGWLWEEPRRQTLHERQEAARLAMVKSGKWTWLGWRRKSDPMVPEFLRERENEAPQNN